MDESDFQSGTPEHEIFEFFDDAMMNDVEELKIDLPDTVTEITIPLLEFCYHYRKYIFEHVGTLLYGEKAFVVEDVIKYQAEISILPPPLCTFLAKKIPP